ncbi:MAG: molecular chaperone TorD family protein [Deltaproteobacteria bacterium]|nr:molecular chaperone TorD family protein [Deltaproteobacteria bacterium]
MEKSDLDVGVEKGRAELYQFFGSLFLAQPTPELLNKISSKEGSSALEALFPGHPAVTALRVFSEDYRHGQALAEDIVVDYEALFRIPGDAYIHPFESVYRDENFRGGHARRTRVLGLWALQVANMYEAEGLAPAEGFTELPDHLGVELQFMAVLCRKAARALEKGGRQAVESLRRKQLVFLEDHLLCWSPQCLQLMTERATTTFYRSLARLLSSYMEKDRSWLSRN